MLADRVKETSTTTGTGTVSLDGAVTGFQDFVTALGDGAACYYAIQHQTADEWEVGIGTIVVSGTATLTRDTVLASSDGVTAVSLASGTKDVFITAPACKLMGGVRRHRENCLAATTANITLSDEQTIDGVSLVTGDRVLVKNQSNSSENGIYIVSAGSGTWERACDMREEDYASGNFTYIEAGTVNAYSVWACVAPSGTDLVGTDALDFFVFAEKRNVSYSSTFHTDTTDEAIARWHGTDSRKIQDSVATLTDDGKAKIPAVYGGITSPVVSGSTITCDGSASNRFDITLYADKTIAFSNMSVGQVFLVRLHQDPTTGGWEVTWSHTIRWVGGTPPTLTPGVGAIDVLVFYCISDGVYDGFVVGQDMST